MTFFVFEIGHDGYQNICFFADFKNIKLPQGQNEPGKVKAKTWTQIRFQNIFCMFFSQNAF